MCHRASTVYTGRGSTVLKGERALFTFSCGWSCTPSLLLLGWGEELWGGGVGDGLQGLRWFLCIFDQRMLTVHSLKCSTVAPTNAIGRLGDICVYVTLQQHGPLFVYTHTQTSVSCLSSHHTVALADWWHWPLWLAQTTPQMLLHWATGEGGS